MIKKAKKIRGKDDFKIAWRKVPHNLVCTIENENGKNKHIHSGNGLLKRTKPSAPMKFKILICTNKRILAYV